MRNRISLTTTLSHSLLTIFIGVLVAACILPTAGRAQDSGILPGETLDQDKVRTTRISASVVDNEPPSIPILISPPNTSFQTTGNTTFVWKSSTDNTMLSHYQLNLNGEPYAESISLTSTETSEYSLEYNPLTDEYRLNPKTNLSDGTYAWQILAYDIHGNFSSSVIWTFTIDTRAPFFTIEEVDSHVVSISTLDAGSVPEEAIVLTNNQPELSGSGEAGSEVVLTIFLPNGETETIEFAIDSDGRWSISLPTLPRDVVIVLDFLITDLAGNISVLEGLEVMLPTPVIEVEVPGVLVPLVPPSLIPQEPAPDDPDAPVVIEIPFLPIEEVVPGLVPPFVMDVAEGMSSTVQRVGISIWSLLLSGLGLLLFLVLPVMKITAFLQIYSGVLVGTLSYISKQLIWIIALDSWWRPNSIVATYPNQEALGQSVVRARGIDSSGREIVVDLYTDQRGIIPAFELPDGKYRVTVLDERASFPTLEQAPTHLDWQRFYAGQAFEVHAQSKLREPWLVIPVERQERLQRNRTWRRWVLAQETFQWPLGIGLIGIAFWQLSLVNMLAAAAYWAFLGGRWWVRPAAAGRTEVISTDKQPVPNCICLQRTNDNQVIDISQTDEKGVARLQTKKQDLMLETISWQHHQTEGDLKTTSVVSANSDYELVILQRN